MGDELDAEDKRVGLVPNEVNVDGGHDDHDATEGALVMLTLMPHSSNLR